MISLIQRKTNLINLNLLLENEKDNICGALKKDLNKNFFESYYLEIRQVQHDIQYHLDNIDYWINEKIFINPFRYLTLFLTGNANAVIEYKPRGKVLIIGAWNYPINLCLQPLVGSISAGNQTSVVFPAKEYTPETSNLMIKLFKKYFNHDKSVCAIIGGKNNVIIELQKKWDYIFYTGSLNVGKQIYSEAAKKLTPITLELGGKSPCIVEEQYNMKLLVKRIVWGKLVNCGQTCISPDYFLVDKKYGDKFVKLLINTIKEFYGNKIDLSKDYGRIVNNVAFDRLTNIINNGKNNIIYGGNINKDKLYIQPTIINFKTDKEKFLNSLSMKAEIFGPILPIYYYENKAEINKILEINPEPLVTYLFCKDTDFLDNFRTGSLIINDTLIQMASPLPFGGIGNSGIGQYHGKYSFELFSYKRPKLIRKTYGEIAVRFPPYNILWKKRMIAISQKIFSFRYLNKLYYILKNNWICIFLLLMFYKKLYIFN